MSIKTFHLIFIVIATLFCGAFGVWAVFYNSATDGTLAKVLGALSLIVSGVLAIYAVYFYRKSKNISI